MASNCSRSGCLFSLIAGIEAPKIIVSKQSYNVGILNGNYTIKNISLSAQKTVPGSKLILQMNIMIQELIKFHLKKF